MKNNFQDFTAADFERIEDSAYNEMIDYVRIKREGKAKREDLRQRREQNRQATYHAAV